MTDINDDQVIPSIITSISKQKGKRQRYNIYVDDEYAFSIHEDVLVKHSLSKGEAVELERLQHIAQDEERHQAYLQAIRFLSRRARAGKELEKKLLDKDYKQDTVDFVMQRLIEQRYVNDEEYAAMLTQHRLQSQKKGRRWIRQELTAKGVSRDLIDDAISQIDEETEQQLAYDIAKKRWDRLGDDEPFAKKRKISGFLLRRGYSHAIVSHVLKRLEADSDDNFDELWDEEPYN